MVVAYIARKSGAERLIGVVDCVYDFSHLSPFAYMECNAFACWFDGRRAVRNEKLADVDTVETRCDGNVVSTANRHPVGDGMARA